MSPKKAISSSFFLFLLSIFQVQAQLPDNKMLWTAKPLQWQDFNGTPDHNSSFHANTSSGISYSWSMQQKGDKIDFFYEVFSYFLPEKSWVKPGKSTKHLLAHEQLHFDISELHARKLRQAMKAFDFRSAKNLKPALQSIYKETEVSRAQMQNLFDAESDHSMNLEAQIKWQQYIKEELEKLEEFSS